MRNKRTVCILILSVCLIAAALLFYQCYQSSQQAKRQLEKKKVAWNILREKISKEIKTSRAKMGVVIKDLDIGWQIFYRQDEVIPAASLVKIPIMAACYLAAEEKRIGLKDKLMLTAANKVSGSGELKNRPCGSIFSIEELIGFMICQSDNTACNMLIDFLGFAYLNDSFKRMGLRNTNLSRRMMDFSGRGMGIENYTTSRDMAYLLEKIYHQEFLNKQVSQRCLNLLKHQKVNNRIGRKLPASVVVAHKTGSERNICHDAGIVFTDKGDYLICVLTNKAKASKEAKQLIANLAFYTYSYYFQ